MGLGLMLGVEGVGGVGVVVGLGFVSMEENYPGDGARVGVWEE